MPALGQVSQVLTAYAWQLVNETGEAYTEQNLAIPIPDDPDDLMAMDVAQWQM
jgi:hypothetical protein